LFCGGRVKRIGFSKSGKRRFLCLVCNHTFGKPKRFAGLFYDFVKFYNFVINKINKVALSEQISLSRKSIWRKFKSFFNYLPTPEDSLFLIKKYIDGESNLPWVLGVDGKWLRRQGVMMIYRDVTKKVNLYWSYHFSESYEAIEKDFNRLRAIMKDGLPSGTITDWKGAIVSATNMFLPPLPHQRCLSHVKRQLMRFLPSRSPISATQELRTVAKDIMKIESHQDKNLWKKQVKEWITKYRSLLKEKTLGVGTKKKWWYTHGNLRRTVNLLTFDEKHLFAYLNFSFLPKTNNSIEGINSQIKTKLANHRGMKINQQVSFLVWLFTFKRVKNRKDLKQLWDRFKNKIFRF